MIFEHIPTEAIFFFIIYGITGVVPMIAAVYLLLRRGNAFAPGVTPPLRLRRWAASFFAAMALGHVLWYFFYIYSCDIRSVSYVVVAVVDCVGMLITIAGTLLAMLQDRKRPVWPIVVALVPYVVIGALYIAFPNDIFLNIAIVYLLLLYAIFTIYMVFAVRRYGRWLNDNYADLENKKVWLSQTVSLVCLLLFILYALVGIDTIQIYILHFGELVAFGLLLWRVETLPQLENSSMEAVFFESTPEAAQEKNLPTRKRQPLSIPSNIEELLDELCVNTQLYLQHDLSLLQLAQVLGINRFYLSQYFSRQGTTYNAYINDLRIDHFIRLYREATAAHQSVTAQQLARDSGYRSYSTFGLAFKQRTGQSVTAWMRNTGE